MTNYDMLVIGGGTGNNVAAAAADTGLETALVRESASQHSPRRTWFQDLSSS